MAGSTQTLRARAYAKINLALSVGPPEPPRGYHPIASWFSCVDLYDELVVESCPDNPASDYAIEWAPDALRASPIDWSLDKDLAVRAHRALEQDSGRVLPVRLRLRKRIPVGGGLGGGSSDAAAMLRAVDAVFRLGASEEALRRVAMTLGSDVSFFLDGAREPAQPARSALVEGYGERLRRVVPVGGAVVLLLPDFGCPTGAVYKAYDRAARPLRAGQVNALIEQAQAAGRADARQLFNDLAAPACTAEPRLATALESLRAALGVPVHVTGSGSSMFALAPDDAEARILASKATAGVRGIVAVPTRLI